MPASITKKLQINKTIIRPVLDNGDIIYDACLKSESDAIENVNVKQLLYAQARSDLQVTDVFQTNKVGEKWKAAEKSTG